MKKSVSIILAFILLLSVLSFPIGVSAYSEKEPTKEELIAGFTFDVVYVVIKNEYKFREFSAENFGSDLIDRIDIPYPLDPDSATADNDDYFLMIHIYLKEDKMTKENVLELYRTVKKNEYVKDAVLNFTENEFPVYPDTPEQVGVYYGAYRPYIEPDHDKYGSKGAGMIYNPYYKCYGNDLLEYSYSVYQNIAEYMGDIDYVGWFIDTYLEKDESFITVILTDPVDFPEEIGAMIEYSTGIIKNHLSEENILYVAGTVPAVVLRVTPEDKNALHRIEEIEFIGDAFFTSNSGSQLAETGVYTLGNVTGRQDEYYEGEKVGSVKFVNAADARLVLRFAAGLENPEKEIKRFYYCADINFDGRITAADARLILRTAAELENEYDLVFGYSSSWNDPMGFIK